MFFLGILLGAAVVSAVGSGGTGALLGPLEATAELRRLMLEERVLEARWN